MNSNCSNNSINNNSNNSNNRESPILQLNRLLKQENIEIGNDLSGSITSRKNNKLAQSSGTFKTINNDNSCNSSSSNDNNILNNQKTNNNNSQSNINNNNNMTNNNIYKSPNIKNNSPNNNILNETPSPIRRLRKGSLPLPSLEPSTNTKNIFKNAEENQSKRELEHHLSEIDNNPDVISTIKNHRSNSLSNNNAASSLNNKYNKNKHQNTLYPQSQLNQQHSNLDIKKPSKSSIIINDNNNSILLNSNKIRNINKEDTNGRLQLFMVEVKRILKSPQMFLDSPIFIDIVKRTNEIAQLFFDCKQDEFDYEKYAEELLSILNSTQFKILGTCRELVIKLLTIIAKYARVKQIINIESNDLSTTKNSVLSNLNNVSTTTTSPITTTVSSTELSEIKEEDDSIKSNQLKDNIGTIQEIDEIGSNENIEYLIPDDTPIIKTPAETILEKRPITFQKSHYRCLSFSPKLIEQQQKQRQILLNQQIINSKRDQFISPQKNKFELQQPQHQNPEIFKFNDNKLLNSTIQSYEPPSTVKPPLLSRKVSDLIYSKQQLNSTTTLNNNLVSPPQQPNSITTTILQPSKDQDFQLSNSLKIITSPDLKNETHTEIIDEDNLLSTSDEEESDEESNYTETSESEDEEDKRIFYTRDIIKGGGNYKISNNTNLIHHLLKPQIQQQQQQKSTSSSDNKSPVFLLDPRLNDLKTTSDEYILKRPLVRSKSFSPNKEEEKPKVKEPYRKLARSFSEIPSVKLIDDKKDEQLQMAMCRICEEPIHSSLLEDHSKICAMANEEDMKAMNVEDHLRAVAKILLTRSSDLPVEKRKMLTELREIALFAVENGVKENLKMIHLMNEIIKNLDTKDENKEIAIKIQNLISEKVNALKRAEEVINSSPRIFRTNSPRILKSPRDDCSNSSSSNNSGSFLVNDNDSIGSNYSNGSLSNFNNNDSVNSSGTINNKSVSSNNKLEINSNNKLGNNLNNNSPITLLNTPLRIIGRSRSDSDPVHQPNIDYRPKGIPTISDFEFIKPITKGGYGKVFLAKKIRTGDIYAIKRLKKSDMIKKNQLDHVKVERNILAYTSNPFVVKMYYSFQTKDYYYLVMEYLQGGDCFSLLQSLGALDEDMARMIIAETVLALEYLHSHGIIHRDLKPDNLLIDKNGHIKLTDFGLSKVGLLDKQNVVPPSYYSPTLKGANPIPQQIQQPMTIINNQTINPPPAPIKKERKLLSLAQSKSLFTASSSSPAIPSLNLLNYEKHVSPLMSGLTNKNHNISHLGPISSNSTTTTMPTPNNNTSNKNSLNNSQSSMNSNQNDSNNSISQPPQNIHRKLSCVGTPDYLAPEILLGIGHGASADWFSLGVILYEFLCGISPFNGSSVQETFQNILQRNITWPDEISEDARDLIDKLLALDPKSRLGYNGAQEIKSHPFFKTINWKTILTQEPFFKPNIDNLQDTSYFDPRKEYHDVNISEDLAESCKNFIHQSNSSINSSGNSSSGNGSPNTSENLGGSSSVNINANFDDFLYVNFQSLLELNKNYLAETKPYPTHRRRNSC